MPRADAGADKNYEVIDAPINKALVHQELSRLQFGASGPLIVFRQLPIGYGGQIGGRITALKIALALGRTAVFETDADPPYIQSLYRPFQLDREISWNRKALAHLDLFAPDFNEICAFDYNYANAALSAADRSVGEWLDRNLERKFASIKDWRACVDGWIFDWLRFLPSFEERAEQDRVRLGISQATLGVHLRRGDKSVESAYVPPAAVNEAISRIHELWTFESVFLASDDPHASTYLSVPKGVRLIFDEKESRYNNANHKMLLANRDMAADETYVAFKNLRLLASCGGLVGQTNAHFATIASSFILQRDGRMERVLLIDGQLAERQSWLIGAAYGFKRKTRSLVKRMTPDRVLRHLDRMRHRR